MKMPSQKMMYIWAMFLLFVYTCIARDAVIVGVVGGVVTITANWLFNVRYKEKRDNAGEEQLPPPESK